MFELISDPAIYFSFMLLSLLIGVLIGTVFERKATDEALDHAYQEGKADGQSDGDQKLTIFRDELSEEVGEELAEMREGLIHTLQAYRRVVNTCGERLAFPGDQQISLIASLMGPSTVTPVAEEGQQADVVIEASGENQQGENKLTDEIEAQDESLEQSEDVPEGLAEQDSKKPVLEAA